MTYTIHRYPVHLIDVFRLRDGERVTVRPVLPQDAKLIQSFIGGLEPASRYNRLMAAIEELSPSLLQRLTNIDYQSHVALIAEIFTDAGEVVIGEARHAAYGGEKNAEFAIAVADAWQGRGIGSLLLARLEWSARATGIHRLQGETFADNERMLGLARKAGFAITADPELPWLMHLAKDLHMIGLARICGAGLPEMELVAA